MIERRTGGERPISADFIDPAEEAATELPPPWSYALQGVQA